MEEIKNKKWINVLEREPDIKNDGTEDVGPFIQKIISETDFCILYFPKGKYLFKTGIAIDKEITLHGDSDSSTSATEFITRGVPNMSIITLTGRKQCIKNISFYSDSCEMIVHDEPPTKGNPHYHYEMFIKRNENNEEMKGVSAITCTAETTGLGHYENLYITGFSGTGIQIPYYSIVNDITVSSCGLGIDTGNDIIISNSRIYECQKGMEIKVGASLNNIKIEKIQEVGLRSKGGGSYKINNITIDQCGHCGFAFGTMINTSISGIIRRCGQYYYNTDYDTYSNMENRKEDAYSLFYGENFKNCHVNLLSDNKDNWDDGLEYKHKVYVFETLQIPNSTLKCSIDAYDYIVKSVHGGGNLRLQNNFNDYIFIDSSVPEIVNGINLKGYHKNRNLLMLDNGKLSFKTGTGTGDEKKNIFRAQQGLIVTSLDSDISQIKSTYGGEWVKLGSELIGKETVYYYEVPAPPKSPETQKNK
ncbi:MULTISPECIES: glycoside hydrolase family 55 protein [unclassified Clostridioides]|uniref:glycoside hydrolase family 55 protein n=1 Tax=unclassified Clostridioides TaxID=2635829 RepID=UPI001D0F661D|nr:glycoside hydrolase family 55 protein [Clostridioides sp. ZZV14-6104]MCC0726592.1 glycoside hydrolase family 55 protein [Clostridioides sp. ZZV14-6045]MCC0730580.1 glycoside hydrolase family 55 protein [Clostridioides sp. ZZV14-6048]MCC0735993.1 glycoside hydrolase family 55 protein [Clostridioides sp. ZZV14-6009]WLD29536.1 Pectate lyase superfamily protein [Clostridioides difficile]